ncbi:dihydroxyacetone kinase transcriptional activator DhaS [Thermoanaerobacterium saccharolyticum]|uniref:dihydroxyacetone kinase transcriptional activator DhaS n=1 Tax=Thermoanaerobacterium saccharolyticum TaxID=28896 RepID=UPI0005EEAB19
MANSQITKKAMADALKELMKTKPLNKISVQDIVNKCGLNRQTFYYHFHDIFELLEWIYKKEAIEKISQYKNYEHWTEGFYQVFKYIEDNKLFCMNTLNSLGREHLENYLYSVTYDLVIGVVYEISRNMKVKEKHKEFIANFYTLAFIGLIIQWMKKGMKEEPEKLIKDLIELIEGNFMKALQKYELCD